jgi:ATP-dependent helicase/nuclease subunit A
VTNLLIEASAGTGKTQRLGERLIELLRAGVRPSEIVALTFSRAAAGEIFERFVGLLADRAGDSPEHAALLRSVLATQHLSQIGTLDSFLMRIVRSFPMELGLVGDIDVMDDYEAGRERAQVSFSILRRTEASVKKTFLEAFAQATNRQDMRSYVEAYRAFIGEWHARVAALPDRAAWGDPTTIWGCDPRLVHVAEEELAGAADSLEGMFDGKPWQDFADWVRGFRGSFSSARGIAKKLLEEVDPFAGDACELSFSRRVYSLTQEQTKTVCLALLCTFGYVLRKQLELARGVYTVVSAYEREYDRRVRRAGRLVFEDVPRLLKELPADARLALEYRLDAHIRAWALDEFQDTSREQWDALANLIDEARQSAGEKSVFVVGDRKQAIYGWRNGDVGIFTHERESGAYELGELKKTYRSGIPVVTAVNRVFAGGRIKEEFPAWECPVHETARPELTGFVRVEDAPGRDMEDFVEPVLVALRANLGERADDPRRRDVSAAVLVRGNGFGEFLAARLRAEGLQGVVWEGESRILDTPALAGFLDLVQLADHPGDAVVYRHFRMTALAAALWPDGVPEASALSREMAKAFTTRGLVRTLRELRARLPADPDAAWSRFTEERFTDLLRAAGTFELAMSAGTRLSDFASFLESREKRSVAEKGKIRILSIHRSKGLGFDYVVLPLYETRSLTREPDGPLFGRNWILPDPGSQAVKHLGGLDEAYRQRKDRAEQEALCTYYVAMTRAKRAMTIVMLPESKSKASSKPEAKRPALWFSDLVRAAGLGDLANPGFAFGTSTANCPPPTVHCSLFTVHCSLFTDHCPPPTVHCSLFTVHCPRAPRARIARRLPSLSFVDGMSAGALFASAEGRAAALRRGNDAHAAMAGVEFSDALPKPANFVALWREKPFEVFADGEWVSGRFDRVTFFRDAAGELCAEIVDFKTALKDPSRYDGQLAAYRRAVAALTGISPDRISARLMAL